MSKNPATRQFWNRSDGSRAHSTMAFAAIGDHVRLPARFFARLFASDGSLRAR